MENEIMSTVEYIHSSAYGSYHIPCKILEKLDENSYRISFFHPITLNEEERIVNRGALVLPKLADYVM